MKIYQIHEYSGEYEDFRNRIVGSYMKKERAEEEKTRLEAEEKKIQERSRRCGRCPFLEEDFKDLDKLMSEYFYYCDEAKLEDIEGYGIDCENYHHYFDESTYHIEEVEVIE